VAEGRLVVRRLLEARRFNVRSLLVSEAAAIELEPIARRLCADVPIYVCPVALFRELTGFNLHRGCLALAERPRALSLDEVVGRADRVVVLEGVANPDNIGGVFRNAAAFGVDGLVLSPTCSDPLYRKAIRTSMGASLQVPFSVADDWPAGLSAIASHGFTIVALTPREPSERLEAAASGWSDRRVAVLAGSEGDGLSEAALAVAHSRVRIPIRPEVDSLNLAVATGIVLSRLTPLRRL
jgi:tRNA G18 (ribose-2'-O)-methylase SpoU